jgi:hypothetical protein
MALNRFDDLRRGSYRLKFEAAGFKTIEIFSTTVGSGPKDVLDEKLEAAELIAEHIRGSSAPAQQENLPNAPSSSATAPSLSDLGLSPE